MSYKVGDTRRIILFYHKTEEGCFTTFTRPDRDKGVKVDILTLTCVQEKYTTEAWFVDEHGQRWYQNHAMDDHIYAEKPWDVLVSRYPGIDCMGAGGYGFIRAYPDYFTVDVDWEIDIVIKAQKIVSGELPPESWDYLRFRSGPDVWAKRDTEEMKQFIEYVHAEAKKQKIKLSRLVRKKK